MSAPPKRLQAAPAPAADHLADQDTHLLQPQMSGAPFEAQVTAALRVDETFQTIDGFGASLAYSAQNITGELADLLFSEAKGLGFSLARIRINFRETDAHGKVLPNSWERRAAQKAQERGARVWASPWSANESLKEGASGKHGHKAGRLKDAEYATYAQNLVDFVRWSDDHQIDLLALSPQNEPDYRFESNESMDWEPAELTGFITDHLRPALDAAGYRNLPIVAPELMDWHRQNGWEDFYHHPDTDILAFHNYDWAYDFFSNDDDTRFPRPIETDKPIWLTEISDVFSGETSTDTIEDALVWARHIHRVIAEVGATAWHWWWFAPAAHGKNNNETILATRAGVFSGGDPIPGEPQVLKRGYAMAQFAKFIRPGDQRVRIAYPAETDKKLHLSAYKGPGRATRQYQHDGARSKLLSAHKGPRRATVVAINEHEAPRNLRLTGIPADFTTTHAWATTDAKNLADLGPLPPRQPTA
ncbi:MAG: hypothetical protein ACLFS1_06255, partial [Opitutales bacterium]